MIPLPWALLAFVLAIAGAAAGGEWHGRGAERDKIEAEAARDAHVAQVASEASQKAAAAAIAGIQVQHVNIKQPLQKEIVEHTVYRDCDNTPTGLSLINSAITGTLWAVPPGDRELPTAPAAH
ncbi:MAG: hypothetical protein U1F35_05495 [Steroidobacteraceae bacterium]